MTTTSTLAMPQAWHHYEERWWTPNTSANRTTRWASFTRPPDKAVRRLADPARMSPPTPLYPVDNGPT